MKRVAIKIAFTILFLTGIAMLPETSYAQIPAWCQNQNQTCDQTYLISGNPRIISAVICKIETIVNTSMRAIYTAIANNVKRIIWPIAMLYILIYAIGFMYGISNTNIKDFWIRIMKLSLVFAILGNDLVFFCYIYSFFKLALLSVTSIVAGVSGPSGGMGDYLSVIINSALRPFEDIFGISADINGLFKLGFLISALAISGPNIFISILSMLGVVSLIMALGRVVLTFGIAVVGVGFLSLLAPIFFCFFLFNFTRRLFDSWLSAIVSFTLQPALALIFLSVMTGTPAIPGLIDGPLTDLTRFANLCVERDARETANLVYEQRTFNFSKINLNLPNCPFRNQPMSQVVKQLIFLVLVFLISTQAVVSFLSMVPQLAQKISHINTPQMPILGVTMTRGSGGIPVVGDSKGYGDYFGSKIRERWNPGRGRE